MSLINTDTKILAHILATRQRPLMPNMVLPDQSGFIPERSMAQNLRTIFALLHQLNLSLRLRQYSYMPPKPSTLLNDPICLRSWVFWKLSSGYASYITLRLHE